MMCLLRILSCPPPPPHRLFSFATPRKGSPHALWPIAPRLDASRHAHPRPLPLPLPPPPPPPLTSGTRHYPHPHPHHPHGPILTRGTLHSHEHRPLLEPVHPTTDPAQSLRSASPEDLPLSLPPSTLLWLPSGPRVQRQRAPF